MGHRNPFFRALAIVAFMTAAAPWPASAGWFDSDGDTYDECMELRRETLKTPAQFTIAQRYCISKHPAAETKPKPEDVTPLYYRIRIDETDVLPGARAAVSRIDIKGEGQITRSDLDNEYTIEINALNRNTFPLEGLFVGFKPRTCSDRKCAPDTAYEQIVLCSGGAQANLSETFTCTTKARPAGRYCKVGFVVRLHPNNVKAFKADLEKTVPLAQAAATPTTSPGSTSPTSGSNTQAGNRTKSAATAAK